MLARRALLLFVILAGCDVGPNGLGLGNPVAVVQVMPTTTSVYEGDTIRLVAVTLDRDGNRVTPRKTPRWFTPDVNHASVDTTGLVRGLVAGPAAIWVTADSVTGIATVAVLALPAASVEIVVPAGAVEAGDSARFGAIVRDATGKRLVGLTVHWASSDTSRARIDSSGLFRAIAPGSTHVTATVDAVSGGVDVAVLVPVAAVRVTPDSLALQYDDTARLSVTLLDSTGSILPSRPIVWSIAGDPGVITLSPSLGVTAIGAGRAVLTASAGHALGRAIVDVSALELTAISAGAAHSCGLRSDGTAFCWGDGATGALGRGDTLSASRPRRVAGGIVFVQLSAGDGLTCGLTPQGVPYCWGLNQMEQTGTLGGSPCVLNPNPSGAPGLCVLTPSPVQGGVGLATIVAGEVSACGLTAAGAAYCWGAGGILGDSTSQSSGTPVAVVGGHVFREIGKPNNSGTCGRDVGGTIYCWGVAPGPLPNAGSYDTLTGSAGMFCGTTGGDLFCWGWLPTSDVEASGSGPVHLLPGTKFSSIAATAGHLCGISIAGETHCWGRNLNGELGDGTLISRFDSMATTVAGSHDFTTIEVGGRLFGESHSCGLASDGRAYCWGANAHGQIGRPVGARSPRPVTLVGQP